MAANFYGAWRLKSYLIKSHDGKIRCPGKSLNGILIYSPCGYMSVVITKARNSITNLSDVIAYSGRFFVNENQIEHYVETSTIPRFLDEPQIRSYSLKESILVLSMVNPNGETHTLEWTLINNKDCNKFE